MESIFLDTSFTIALVSSKDKHHKQSVDLSFQLENQKIKIVTTRAIVIEIGNSLAKMRFRDTAIDIIAGLENDPHIEIVALTEKLYNQAFKLFSERQDKEWGLTDCISFVVMKNRKIKKALTADRHFIQAGFEPLLKI